MHHTYQWYGSPVNGYRCAHPGGLIKIRDGLWQVYLGFQCNLYLHGASAVVSVTSCGQLKHIGPANAKGIRPLGLCQEGTLEIRFDDEIFQQCPEARRACYWQAEEKSFHIEAGSYFADWDSDVSYDSSSSADLRDRFGKSDMDELRVRRSRVPIIARLVQCPALLVRGGLR